MKKKIVSLFAAFAMAFALIPLTALSAYAADAESGFTTDEHGLMEYKVWDVGCQYQIKGFVNNEWRQVTYHDSNIRSYGFRAKIYNDNGNLTISHTPKFIADGRAIQVDYTVKNTGEANAENVRFFLAADTAINGVDSSTNTKNGNAVIMTSGDISLFGYSPTEGSTLVPTEYSLARAYSYNKDSNYVYYYDAVFSNADPSTVTFFDTVNDSAFVIYFPEETIAAGAEKTYNLVLRSCLKGEPQRLALLSV